MDDESKYPSQLAERFQLRLPPGLRDRIAGVARANGRSMNTEIVRTLENSYPTPIGRAEIKKALETVLERMAREPNVELSWHMRMLMPELVETVEAGAVLETDVVETEKISNP